MGVVEKLFRQLEHLREDLLQVTDFLLKDPVRRSCRRGAMLLHNLGPRSLSIGSLRIDRDLRHFSLAIGRTENTTGEKITAHKRATHPTERPNLNTKKKQKTDEDKPMGEREKQGRRTAHVEHRGRHKHKRDRREKSSNPRTHRQNEGEDTRHTLSQHSANLVGFINHLLKCFSGACFYNFW